jgi:penicillin-binding protein 2
MINPFSQRKIIISAIILFVFAVFMGRLFYMQLIDDSYKYSAQNNSQRRITKYPARGVIFDRFGKILVYNEPAFDLMVIPQQTQAFDTVDLSNILEIDTVTLRNIILKARIYSKYKPSIVIPQLSLETTAILKEKFFKFPGFFLQSRTLRKYPKPIAAHLLGYVGEVDDNLIKENSYYKMGDYIGISGLERTYEKYLKGKKGVSIYLVDVHNRIVGNFAEGIYDTAAIPGNNITTSIDLELQEYGEQLMQNKKGSIVAIDPQTGEILALISSPNYDPSLLVGRKRTQNYVMLLKDTLKPLFNRALMAKYPPGSTFKMVGALIGQQEEVIFPSTTFSCNRGFSMGNIHVGCHVHPSPLNLPQSIQHSCNAYYCNVFLKIMNNRKYKNTEEAFHVWRDYVTSFGFGTPLGSDLSYELKGNVPTSNYYDKYFGKHRWGPLTIISLGIGQGELGITPLQLANYACIIANRGFYYIPHVMREVQDVTVDLSKYKVKQYTKIDSKYFDPVIEGMENVVLAGTARIAKIDSISMCGKTGTAQNPHGKDHSIFMAFAPKENTKIAISVIVENAGFGATYAAPIASLMIEKYITRKIKRKDLEQQVLETNLIH